ncbi:hypothetical protein ACRE_029620 [Hapsidospora chrysogenum ATCC 11550]|uniref:Uncharacterized protein n=1 Tax=Hapsidospora chrysogenum (strain ATCC 11550 / CBS 779.69 / DSM 880 / IAM 14645 / JCM 23072 / IMI 49137) TaxID=857340 RepID=A0A086TA26_HAPC1|nr:hypothetical protein ACRE_029620 [Hapsidospora chrysogenum ATCC 11550]
MRHLNITKRRTAQSSAISDWGSVPSTPGATPATPEFDNYSDLARSVSESEYDASETKRVVDNEALDFERLAFGWLWVGAKTAYENSEAAYNRFRFEQNRRNNRVKRLQDTIAAVFDTFLRLDGVTHDHRAEAGHARQYIVRAIEELSREVTQARLDEIGRVRELLYDVAAACLAHEMEESKKDKGSDATSSETDSENGDKKKKKKKKNKRKEKRKSGDEGGVSGGFAGLCQDGTGDDDAAEVESLAGDMAARENLSRSSGSGGEGGGDEARAKRKGGKKVGFWVDDKGSCGSASSGDSWKGRSSSSHSGGSDKGHGPRARPVKILPTGQHDPVPPEPQQGAATGEGVIEKTNMEPPNYITTYERRWTRGIPEGSRDMSIEGWVKDQMIRLAQDALEPHDTRGEFVPSPRTLRVERGSEDKVEGPKVRDGRGCRRTGLTAPPSCRTSRESSTTRSPSYPDSGVVAPDAEASVDEVPTKPVLITPCSISKEWQPNSGEVDEADHSRPEMVHDHIDVGSPSVVAGPPNSADITGGRKPGRGKRKRAHTPVSPSKRRRVQGLGDSKQSKISPLFFTDELEQGTIPPEQDGEEQDEEHSGEVTDGEKSDGEVLGLWREMLRREMQCRQMPCREVGCDEVLDGELLHEDDHDGEGQNGEEQESWSPPMLEDISEKEEDFTSTIGVIPRYGPGLPKTTRPSRRAGDAIRQALSASSGWKQGSGKFVRVQFTAWADLFWFLATWSHWAVCAALHVLFDPIQSVCARFDHWIDFPLPKVKPWALRSESLRVLGTQAAVLVLVSVAQVYVALQRERRIWMQANGVTRVYMLGHMREDPSWGVLPGVDPNLMVGGMLGLWDRVGYSRY